VPLRVHGAKTELTLAGGTEGSNPVSSTGESGRVGALFLNGQRICGASPMDPEQSSRRLFQSYRPALALPEPNECGRRLSDGLAGIHPRARYASMGDDPDQPRRRALDARGARERDDAPGGGSRRLPVGIGEYTRERVPLEWAATQTNLGAALLRLGERESGTARLEQAVAAYPRNSGSSDARAGRVEV
jgi:hypothetical protein